MLLLGILDKDTVTHDVANSTYSHKFTHNTDEFDAPWFTGRQAPGQLWGEIYPDMRMSPAWFSLWRAARFVEAEAAFVGAGVPSKAAALTGWSPADLPGWRPAVPGPLGTIELPTSTAAAVTSGALAMSLTQPVDDKMIVGSYSPATLDIVRRTYVLSLVLRIEDGTLYNKMQLDPAGGTAWVAKLMRSQHQAGIQVASRCRWFGCSS